MGAKAQKMMSVAQAVAAKGKTPVSEAGMFGRMNDRIRRNKAAEKAAEKAARPVPPTMNSSIGAGAGISNFESELKAKRKKTRTSFAGSGYGGNTNLG